MDPSKIRPPQKGTVQKSPGDARENQLFLTVPPKWFIFDNFRAFFRSKLVFLATFEGWDIHFRKERTIPLQIHWTRALYDEMLPISSNFLFFLSLFSPPKTCKTYEKNLINFITSYISCNFQRLRPSFSERAQNSASDTLNESSVRWNLTCFM